MAWIKDSGPIIPSQNPHYSYRVTVNPALLDIADNRQVVIGSYPTLCEAQKVASKWGAAGVVELVTG